MKKSLHIIYIPGIGDSYAGQQKAVNTWKWWGVTAELFEIEWYSGAWEPKFDELLRKVDTAAASGQSVGLVAASAGASAAINVFAARPKDIAGIVLIAGKVNRPGAIGGSYRRQNPAFISSAQASVSALSSLSADQRGRILSRFALLDEVVLPRDSRIEGARNQRVLSIGHVITIATQITLGAPSFIRFLKNQVKNSQS